MGEVDTIFTIKQMYSLLFIMKTFLQGKKMYSVKALEQSLKRRGVKERITELLEEAFANANAPKKSKRMDKYRQHDVLLRKKLSLKKNNPFEDTIPIFINGECASDYFSSKKYGIDPYSNLHLFSTQFIEIINSTDYPTEFLEKLRLVYVQPVTYIQKIIERDDKLGLEDILKKDLEEKIKVKGIGFGTLEKFDDETPKTGNSIFSRVLLSADYAIENIDEEDVEDLWSEEQRVRKEVKISQHLMGMKMANILNMIYLHLKEAKKRYWMDGVPLYMEKTSPSAKIMEYAKKSIENYIPLFFIGGEQGILGNSPDKIPTGGICHPTALGKLFGFIETCYQRCSGEFAKRNILIKKREKQTLIEFDSSGELPFLLCEGKTKDRRPNIKDLAHEILTQEQIDLVKLFAQAYRIGFSRIEPRIVNLMTEDVNIYTGLRCFNKENKRWFTELDGKELITPDMIPGFFEMKCIEDKKGDFRGSELALPTGPKINAQWLKKYYDKERIDAGCSIQKLITPFQENVAVLKEQLADSPKEFVDEFFMYNTKEFKSIPAMKGLAIHSLSSDPLDELVHYETLGLLSELTGMPFSCNIKPKSSKNYCETPFFMELNINGRKFTASMHPDSYLFLKRGEKEYDIIIIDTKTNRVTPYPEHKYLQQTFFYGWMIKQAMEKELDVEIENIYTVFNKNAFHRGFGEMPKKVVPHLTYREQKYSPITVFTPSDVVHEFIPAIVGKIIEEKEILRKDAIEFIQKREESHKCGYCSKCYMGHKLICNWIADKLDDGQNMDDVFEKLEKNK